jgi:hypothetical protein
MNIRFALTINHVLNFLITLLSRDCHSKVLWKISETMISLIKIFILNKYLNFVMLLRISRCFVKILIVGLFLYRKCRSNWIISRLLIKSFSFWDWKLYKVCLIRGSNRKWFKRRVIWNLVDWLNNSSVLFCEIV